MLDVDDKNACSIDLINFTSTNECSSERCLLQTTHCVLYGELSTADGRIQSLIYHRIFVLTGPTAMKSAFLMASYSKGNRSSFPMQWEVTSCTNYTKLTSGLRKPGYSCASLCTGQTSIKAEMMAKFCAVCQESQMEHRQQALLAHDVPSTSWTKVANDMFQIKGDNYLHVTDYHSKFYLVGNMHSTTSTAITNKSVCSVVQHVLTTTRNSQWQRPTVCRTAIRRHVQKWNIKHTTTSLRIPSIEWLDRDG